MARKQALKVTSHGAPVGGLRRADFKGGDEFEIHGYWMHPTRRALVEVPIFQHAFYPTLKHTQLDIEQNISYRTVTVPSLADLHGSGIEAEKGIFVAEIYTHPRYIKNTNIFRSDLPANIKAVARQNNIALVLPANDNPFSRMKRKVILSFYRAAFAPLLIKGQQYMSGRMKFFFVAPPHVTASFRKRLNLEHDEDANMLTEAATAPRARVARPSVRQKTHGISPELVAKTANRMHREVSPVVISQLGIPAGSKGAREIDAYLSDPKTSLDFLESTYSKPSKTAAVKRWVTQSFWPRAKEIMIDETLLAAESLGRFVVKTAITITFNHLLDKAKAEPPKSQVDPAWKQSFRRHVGKFDYLATSGEHQVGSGWLGYTHPPSAVDIQRAKRALRPVVYKAYVEYSKDHDLSPVGQDFFFIHVTPQHEVVVDYNLSAIKSHLRNNPEVCGEFNGGAEWIQRAKKFLPGISTDATEVYRETIMRRG